MELAYTVASNTTAFGMRVQLPPHGQIYGTRLQVHHIDGNGFNNELSNLQLLCPNCHSQTDTYAGRNINNGKQKVSDEEFVNALKTNKSIR